MSEKASTKLQQLWVDALKEQRGHPSQRHPYRRRHGKRISQVLGTHGAVNIQERTFGNSNEVFVRQRPADLRNLEDRTSKLA
jgi:hypothetical protein